MKKIIAALISTLLCVGCDDPIFNFNNDDEVVVMPSNIILYTSTDGKPIAVNMFALETEGIILESNSYEDGIGKLVFNQDITHIPDYIFVSATNLKTMTLPNSITAINIGAFESCSSLESIELSESLTHIADLAFSNCASLTSITLPESLESVAPNAFPNCTRLAVFKGKYASEDGRAIIIGDTLVAFAPASTTSYIIPEHVTTLGVASFRTCHNLREVVLHDNVTTIESMAFEACSSLNSINLPNSLISIGEAAFASCSSLENIVIPESVESIGIAAYTNCSNIESFTGKFTSEDNRCLIINDVMIAFAPSNLTTYTIPNGVTHIGRCTFRGAYQLKSIWLPDSLIEIGDMAFNPCGSLADIHFGNGVKVIGKEAFFSCHGLEEITISDSVTTIKSCAFSSCDNLKVVTIGSSVEVLSGSFLSNPNLHTIYCRPSNPPTISNGNDGYCGEFAECSPDLAIYVPESSITEYKEHALWSIYSDIIHGYNFAD